MSERVMLFKSRFLRSPKLIEGCYYPEQRIITTGTGKSGTFYKIDDKNKNLGIPGLRGFIWIDRVASNRSP